MKLYYLSGACSMAPHIVANETGLPFEFFKVDRATKKTETGADYLTISPNGYVPALEMENGEILTEASVIVQYIADQKPESGLIPVAGDFKRYRVQQWLAFTATEFHKSFSPFFKPTTPEETKTMYREILNRRLGFVETSLDGKTYLMGEQFTVADAYLWTVLRWSKAAALDLSAYPNVHRYMDTVAQRPAVQKTLTEEGLA